MQKTILHVNEDDGEQTIDRDSSSNGTASIDAAGEIQGFLYCEGYMQQP